MIVDGSNMGVDIEFPQQQLPCTAEILVSAEGRLGIKLKKLYFRLSPDPVTKVAYYIGILPHESMPWSQIDCDGGLYFACIAKSVPPSGSARPVVMLVPRGGPLPDQLLQRLGALQITTPTEADRNLAPLDEVVRYLTMNECRSGDWAWHLLDPAFLELLFIGRRDVLNVIVQQATDLYCLAADDKPLDRKSVGASFPTVFVSAGRGKTRFMQELEKRAGAGHFGPPSSALVLAAAFGHSVLGEYMMASSTPPEACCLLRFAR